MPAFLFTALTLIAIIFQLALALGAPWGAASMGGKYPGKYPSKMRVVALLNILVLGFAAGIVLSAAGVAFHVLEPIADVGIWVVVGFFGLSTIMNTITPSRIERIWAPVALAQTICALLVALS
jgi:hypothetical protein